MNREEAIEFANEWLKTIDENEKDSLTYEFLAYVIHALQQEPCGDAISRQEAIDAMYSLCGDGTLKENEWRDNPHIDSTIDALNELPSVSTEKAGHWIRQSQIHEFRNYYKCSVCGKGDTYLAFDFCSNCGAKMVEPQESEVRNDK